MTSIANFIKYEGVWNKGLTMEDNIILARASVKQSIVRKKGLSEGTIKVWNEGLTKDKDERVKNSAEKLSKTKFKGGSSNYWHAQARKVLGITDPLVIVHHKDGNMKNNNKDNLLATDRANHVRIHIPRKGKIKLQEGNKYG